MGGLFRVVRDLSYVQLDPTSEVARSHLLVLWSRLGAFDPARLERLLERRRLVEYAALIVPGEDLSIYRVRMRQFATGTTAWPRRVRAWMAQNDALRRYVLAALRRRGPLPAQALEDRATVPWASSGWTAGRNVTRMLEFLAGSGTIMVAGRQGGQRLWDLAERVAPTTVWRTRMSDDEATRRRTLNALAALGVATPTHLRAHYVGPRVKDLTPVLSRLQAAGDIAQVRLVDGDAIVPGTWWMRTADVHLARRLHEDDGWRPRTTLLSPFDNLIINRARTEQLFGFRYRMEIYVPRAQRRYGYFAMPVLSGDRLVARVDPRFDRDQGTLWINALHAEPGLRLTPASRAAVVQAIEDLARFLGASRVVYGAGVGLR
jgi:hypothetical protein